MGAVGAALRVDAVVAARQRLAALAEGAVGAALAAGALDAALVVGALLVGLEELAQLGLELGAGMTRPLLSAALIEARRRAWRKDRR